MITIDKRAVLLDIIRDRSVHTGFVRLASGKTSDFYINLKQTLLYPKGLDLIGDFLLDFLNKEVSDLVGVAGLGMGGLPLTTAVSLKSLKNKRPLLAIHIRKQPKEHGTMQFVEGIDGFQAGDKVWILEDVVTTGQSSLLAFQRCQEAKLSVEGILACVDRSEGGGENIQATGLKFHSIFSREDLLTS